MKNSLEEEMIERAARQMSNDIDAEVLRGMLLEIGWHEVVLKPMFKEVGDEIDLWVHKNIHGRNHFAHGLVWMFEEEKDAMWFKMRWMS